MDNESQSEVLFRKTRQRFLIVKNLPLSFRTHDLFSLLENFHIDGLYISYDIFGRSTGICFIKITNESDFKELICFLKYRVINGKIIDTYESNERDFNSAKESEHYITNPVKAEDKIFLKITNLPFLVNEETIKNFFNKYIIAGVIFIFIVDGIKFYKNKKGSNLGEIVVAFKNEQQCREAYNEKNCEVISNQHVVLEYTNLNVFEEFSSSNSFHQLVKSLSNYVVPEIVARSLVINGLPLNINQKKLLETFEIFNLNESNLIIDEKILNSFGCVIATFANPEDAETAKNYLSKYSLNFEKRTKRLQVDNLLTLVNRGNESY